MGLSSQANTMACPVQEKRKFMKMASVVVLTLHNAILTVSMTHSRARYKNLYISSTAVVMSEVVKLYTSLFLIYMTEANNLTHFLSLLHSNIVERPQDILNMCIPSIMYIIHNNMAYLASTYLDGATLQVTYQLKILSTAFFTGILLKKPLNKSQWLSLLLLAVGVWVVQISYVKEIKSTSAKNGDHRITGVGAAILACGLSSFANVYLEKMLKMSDISVWMRNLQLSMIGFPLAMGTVLINDWNTVRTKGFFFGYDELVIFVILLQGLGGLLVAVVIKYADNILKGFATSSAIILSCGLSIFLSNFWLNWKFVVGAVLVIISVFLYGKQARSREQSVCEDDSDEGNEYTV